MLQMKEQSLFYLSKLAGSVPDQLFETYHADTDCGWDYGSHPQVIQLADCGCEPSRALSIAFRGGQDYVYHSKSPLKFCVVLQKKKFIFSARFRAHFCPKFERNYFIARPFMKILKLHLIHHRLINCVYQNSILGSLGDRARPRPLLPEL